VSTGWEAPEGFNFTRDVVEQLAADNSRRALTFVDGIGVIQQFTFAQLAADAARWAHLLRGRGHEPGDRVLVALGKVPAWLGVMLGVLKAGLVAVPCPETFGGHDLAVRVRRSGASVLVLDRRAETEIDEVREVVDGDLDVLFLDDAAELLVPLPSTAPTEDRLVDDPALILYTAGTVSVPKAVTHTHAYTYANRVQAAHWLDASPGDVVWCTAPTARAASVWNLLLGPWSRGAEVVMHGGAFDPVERLELIGVLGVTILCQTPAEYRRMAELDAADVVRPATLRHTVSTGEALPAGVIERFRDAFALTIHDGYGQAENTVLLAGTRDRPAQPGSLGWAVPGHDVSVVDEEGVEVTAGEEGEIALRGRPPSLFRGYWEAPEDTSAAFRGEWYITGDRGTRDEDGSFRFLRRADEVDRSTVQAEAESLERHRIALERRTMKSMPAPATHGASPEPVSDIQSLLAAEPATAPPPDRGEESWAPQTKPDLAETLRPTRRERREEAREAKRAAKARARAEAEERKRREDEERRAAREAREAEKLARRAEEERLRAEAEEHKREQERQREAERERREAEARAQRAEQERLRAEAEEHKREQERQRETERERREAEARAQRAEQERLRAAAEEVKRQEEAERRAAHEARETAKRAQRAEQERLRAAAEEVKRQEEAERRAEHEAREAAKRARAGQERLRAAAEQVKRQEEAERRAEHEAREAAKRARAEEDRLRAEAVERARRLELERREREKAERIAADRDRAAEQDRRPADKQKPQQPPTEKTARKRDRTEDQFQRMLEEARRRTAEQQRQNGEREAERAEDVRRWEEADKDRQKDVWRRAEEEAWRVQQERIEEESRERERLNAMRSRRPLVKAEDEPVDTWSTTQAQPAPKPTPQPEPVTTPKQSVPEPAPPVQRDVAQPQPVSAAPSPPAADAVPPAEPEIASPVPSSDDELSPSFEDALLERLLSYGVRGHPTDQGPPTP
jgi:acyl-coenzyme A synthetase/AMP-(fatty) acid ligase